MKRSLNFILLFSFFSLSACSIYQSAGRKQFNLKSPGNVSSEVEQKSAMNVEEPSSMNCWIQSSEDPLWYIGENTKMNVTVLNQQEIQICVETP